MIGENIRRIRKERGLSQVELAEKVGITQGSLSAFESGSAMPRVVTLAQIASALGVTIDELAANMTAVSKVA